MGVGWLLVSGLGLRLLDYLERPSFKWKGISTHTILKSLIFVQKSHFSALFKFKIFYQIGFKNEIQYFAGFSKS